MNLLTSSDFLKSWLEVVESNKEILLKEWRHAKTFTNLIKSNDECILKQVADKLELKCYASDYYSLDGILYEEIDLVPKIPINNYWFREVKVAFEHENFFNDNLYQEVSHLLIINSSLKVLVAYPPNENLQNRTRNIMDSLHEIIKGASIQKELSKTGSFLVIFGFEQDFKWEAYVYKEDEWKQMN